MSSPKRWVSRAAVALALALPLLVCWGRNPQDVEHYYRYTEATLAGGVPYRDFGFEYPPLVLLLLLIPRIVADDLQEYLVGFIVLMGLIDVAQKTGAWRACAPHRRAALATMALASLGLYYPYLKRFDVAVTALVVAALLAQLRRPAGMAAWVFLATGASLKLFPAFLAPLFWLHARSRGVGARRRVQQALVALAVVLAIHGAAWSVAGPSSIAWLSYHSERGLQLASTYSSVLLLSNGLGKPYPIEVAFGSNQMTGAAPDLWAALSPWVMLGLWGLTLLRFGLGAAAGHLARGCAAVLLALMLGSKVLSPQYLVWLVPVVALAAVTARGFDRVLAIAFVVACVLTSATYPGEDRLASGDVPVQVALLLRNGILLAAWLYLLASPCGDRFRGRRYRIAESTNSVFTKEAPRAT